MTEKEMIEEMTKRYIVLTEEEYKQRLEDFIESNKIVEERVRKETAREILDLLYSPISKTNIVVEIKKRYGVKITDIGGNKND